jgi:enoyl-CoA hydratase
METEVVKVQLDGDVATVTVHRPEKLNVLNGAVLEALLEVFCKLSVRACVLTGAGDKAFVAGADIAQMAGYTSEEAVRFARLGHHLGGVMAEVPYPILAAVNGFCLGGGLELALCCDLLLASDRARFAQPEVGLGVIPGFGGSQRLGRRVGVGKAREMIFVGHTVDAQEALAMGLADRVFPHDRLLPEALAMAGKIARNAPLAVAHAKRVLHTGENVPLAVARELEVQAFGLCFATEDQKSGMRTFLESPKAPRTFVGK